MFGGGSSSSSSSLFGGTPQTAATNPTAGSTSLFGTTTQSQPWATPSLFGSMTQTAASQPQLGAADARTTTPPTSLFATAATAPSTSTLPSHSLFGTQGTGGTLTGSLFGTQQQQQPGTTTAPLSGGGVFGSTSFFGGGGATAASQQQQPFSLSLTQQHHATATSASSLPAGMTLLPEVQKVLENLNNADPPLLVSFTYEVDPDPRSLAQRRSTLEHQLTQLNTPAVSDAYRHAKTTNPDPDRYAIVPIQGFEGIVSRTKLQSQHLDQLEVVLQELKNRQDVVRNHIDVHSLKRFHDVFKRQRQLISSIMRAVGRLEDHALRNSIAQIDVTFLRKLQGDLTTLTDELQQSAAGRTALAQAAVDLQTLVDEAFGGSTSLYSGGVPNDVGGTTSQAVLQKKEAFAQGLPERDVKVLRRIIQKQEALFESLETAFRIDNLKTKKLLELIESHSRNATAPVSSQGVHVIS